MIIDTPAPIPVELLREYFTGKVERYRIDYSASTLKDVVLLTYLGNLNIPCDIELGEELESVQALLKAYLDAPVLVRIPVLEELTIELLLAYKGLHDEPPAWMAEFIDAERVSVERWVRVLDSLTLYNLYMVNSDELKAYVEEYPVENDDGPVGINFVHLLDYPQFYRYYDVLDEANLRYYRGYFNNPVFRGKGLFHHWANPHNPLFLIMTNCALTKQSAEEEVESEEHSSPTPSNPNK